MANVFEQYGIKEVCDLTIYKLHKDNTYSPYLFIDSAKVSTTEQTAEETFATGGKGNGKLIGWDYNKEIKVTLTDALYTPRSMGMLFAGSKEWKDAAAWDKKRAIEKTTKATVANGTTVTFYDPTSKQDRPVCKFVEVQGTQGSVSLQAQLVKDNDTVKSVAIYAADGTKVDVGESGTTLTTIKAGDTVLVRWSQKVAEGSRKLEIGPNDFPGTYRVTGDTYARRRSDGEDEFFQLVFGKAKVSAEETLTLEAEGDPTTFNMNLTIMKPETGNMVELIQYTIEGAEGGSTETDDWYEKMDDFKTQQQSGGGSTGGGSTGGGSTGGNT